MSVWVCDYVCVCVCLSVCMCVSMTALGQGVTWIIFNLSGCLLCVIEVEFGCLCLLSLSFCLNICECEYVSD